jgi:hypothetical protein
MTQWEEMITDPEYKIGRPRQLYIGAARRDVKALGPSADPFSAKTGAAMYRPPVFFPIHEQVTQ